MVSLPRRSCWSRRRRGLRVARAGPRTSTSLQWATRLVAVTSAAEILSVDALNIVPQPTAELQQVTGVDQEGLHFLRLPRAGGCAPHKGREAESRGRRSKNSLLPTSGFRLPGGSAGWGGGRSGEQLALGHPQCFYPPHSSEGKRKTESEVRKQLQRH